MQEIIEFSKLTLKHEDGRDTVEVEYQGKMYYGFSHQRDEEYHIYIPRINKTLVIVVDA